MELNKAIRLGLEWAEKRMSTELSNYDRDYIVFGVLSRLIESSNSLKCDLSKSSQHAVNLKKHINDLLLKMQTGENCISETANELLDLSRATNRSLIDYIENDAEIAMPINELIHEDGRHLTKNKYGKVLLKYLVKELREEYC